MPQPGPRQPVDAAAAPDQRPAPREWWARHLWEIQPLRDALVILSVVGLIYLGYVLSIVTVPLLIATALAYLLEPLVFWLTSGPRGRLFSRPGAALMLVVVGAVLVVGPVVFGVTYGVLQGINFVQVQTSNVQTLVKSLDRPEDEALRAALPAPRWQWLRDRLLQYKAQYERIEAEKAAKAAASAAALPPPSFPGPGGNGGPLVTGPPVPPGVAVVPRDPFELDAGDPLGVTMYKVVRRAGRWVTENAGLVSQEALATGATALSLGLQLLKSVGLFLFGAFLTAFFFFFICIGWGRFQAFWERLIPERRRIGAIQLLKKMDVVIAGFIRGRLLICACMMGYYTLAFLLAGAPAPLILGPIFGALHLIPYAACLSVPIVGVLMWLEPSGVSWQASWWWIVFGPVIVYLLAQAIDDYVLTPAIQGRTTGMDTPTILFASLAGGILGGFYGLLIAIPVGACIKILLKEIVWPRFRAWGEGRAADPLPISGGRSPTVMDRP